MKLRNKKTGEIMQLSVKCENGGELRTFDLNTNTDKPITLTQLIEDWEDYEEPKIPEEIKLDTNIIVVFKIPFEFNGKKYNAIVQHDDGALLFFDTDNMKTCDVDGIEEVRIAYKDVLTGGEE